MTQHRGHPLTSNQGVALVADAHDHPAQAVEMVKRALEALADTEDRRRHSGPELLRVYLRGAAAMALVAEAGNGERLLPGWTRPNPIRGDQVTPQVMKMAVKGLTTALWARRDLARQGVPVPWPPQEHEAAMHRLRQRLLVAARGGRRSAAPVRPERRKAG